MITANEVITTLKNLDAVEAILEDIIDDKVRKQTNIPEDHIVKIVEISCSRIERESIVEVIWHSYDLDSIIDVDYMNSDKYNTGSIDLSLDEILEDPAVDNSKPVTPLLS